MTEAEACSCCGHPLSEHQPMDSEPTLMCVACARVNDQRVCGIPVTEGEWLARLAALQS